MTGRRVLWEVAQEDILQDLERFLDDDERYRADEGMQPRHAEYAFGFDGPPVAMALPGGGEVRFRGFIDRVDVARDGLRAVVMDYKTGSSRQYEKMKDDPLMAGKRLQLPVYALAGAGDAAAGCGPACRVLVRLRQRRIHPRPRYPRHH